MSEAAVLASLVPVLALAGLLAGVAVFVTTGALLGAVAVLLDFLLAAGLLRLAMLDTWASIGSVALVVTVRKLAVAGIRTGPAGPGRLVAPLGRTRVSGRG